MKGIFHRGIGLIEVLVGVSIIAIGFLALSDSYTKYVKYALANNKNVQAAYIGEEGLEAVSFLRDKSWSTYIAPLGTTTTYYLAWDSTNSFWKATTTAQYVDSTFLRTVGVTDVKRDSNGRIISSGGTYDPNTKQITVTEQYSQGHATTTKSMTTYIANIYTN